MKTKKLRIIKMCLIAVAVVFPLPSFNALQTNFWIWAGYVAYLLFMTFFMSMFWEHKYDARDVDNKEIHITQELLKERNKWGSFL